MDETRLERLPGSPGCFACDNDASNPRSLRLKIFWDEVSQSVRVPFTPDPSCCGYMDVVHGGVIAAVLDESMSWAVKKTRGEWAVTADFHLRYKRPVAPGRAYMAEAAVTEDSGRRIRVKAVLLDEDGRPAATAEALFLPAKGLANPQTRPKD